jgi:predicted GNAT superfamily acetyltransferase
MSSEAIIPTQGSPTSPAHRPGHYEIRPLRTHAEFEQCIRLQKDTWGETFSELVPIAILKVSPRIGGVTAGAFDPEGRLAGFVFGMTGVQEGRLVHWSDMLAVRPEARDTGLGSRLKEYQREAVRALGVEVICWTYDPLVAKNAYLNLCRLGARPTEYVPDMYGPDTDSELHRGLGTDRFVVAWEVERPAPPAGEGLPEERVLESPVVNPLDPRGDPTFRQEIDHALEPYLRVQIPADIQAVRAESAERAALWRRTTREAFLASLARGYRVVGFYRSRPAARGYYVLSRRPEEA